MTMNLSHFRYDGGFAHQSFCAMILWLNDLRRHHGDLIVPELSGRNHFLLSVMVCSYILWQPPELGKEWQIISSVAHDGGFGKRSVPKNTSKNVCYQWEHMVWGPHILGNLHIPSRLFPAKRRRFLYNQIDRMPLAD